MSDIGDLIAAGVPVDRIRQMTDGSYAYAAPCPAERMTAVDDLVTWLRAQLDDDERVAREAISWQDDRFTSHEYAWSAISRLNGQVKRQYILAGAPTPTRVLAEVDAKRRMLDDITGNGYDDGLGNASTDGLAGRALSYLALPYADRPGYREEWRA